MVPKRGKRSSNGGRRTSDKDSEAQPRTPEPESPDSPETIGSRLRRKRQADALSPTADKSSPERKRRATARFEGGINPEDTDEPPKPRRGRPPGKRKTEVIAPGPIIATLRQRNARKSSWRVLESSEDEPTRTRKRRRKERVPPLRVDSPSRSSDIHDEIIVATRPTTDTVRRRQRTETSTPSQPSHFAHTPLEAKDPSPALEHTCDVRHAEQTEASNEPVLEMQREFKLDVKAEVTPGSDAETQLGVDSDVLQDTEKKPQAGRQLPTSPEAFAGNAPGGSSRTKRSGSPLPVAEAEVVIAAERDAGHEPVAENDFAEVPLDETVRRSSVQDDTATAGPQHQEQSTANLLSSESFRENGGESRPASPRDSANRTKTPRQPSSRVLSPMSSDNLVPPPRSQTTAPQKLPGGRETLKPESAVTILKIIDYCSEFEPMKKIGGGLGSTTSGDGGPTTGAPRALQVEALPILEELAEQLLHAFATIKFDELSSYVVDRESVGGKAYARLKQLFDDTKKVYATQDHFLITEDLPELGSDASRAARKANLATFATSCFGSGDVGYYHLDRYFLSIFAGESPRLTKPQWSLLLDLKTQSFISAMGSTNRPSEDLLQEVFGGDIEQRLIQRRPGAKALVAGELEFIRQLRLRKEEHRWTVSNNNGWRDRQHRALQASHTWEDFLLDLCRYISKHFDAIVGKQPADLTPLHESGLSLSPRLDSEEGMGLSRSTQPATILRERQDAQTSPAADVVSAAVENLAQPSTIRPVKQARKVTRRPTVAVEKPKRSTRTRRAKVEHVTPIRPAGAAKSAFETVTNGDKDSTFTDGPTRQPAVTVPDDGARSAPEYNVRSMYDPPGYQFGPPPGGHQSSSSHQQPLPPHGTPSGSYGTPPIQYISPFAPPPFAARPSSPNKVPGQPIISGHGPSASPYYPSGSALPLASDAASHSQQHHPYYAAFQRPHYQQSKPTHELYEEARRVANSKNFTSTRSRPQSVSQRRPWTTEEETALMAGLDTVKGPHWSSILAMYGPGGSINEALKGRNQVQLKDKARNLKLFFLKNGIEVPFYLQFVTGNLNRTASIPGQPSDSPIEASNTSVISEISANGERHFEGSGHGSKQSNAETHRATSQTSSLPAPPLSTRHSPHGPPQRTGHESTYGEWSGPHFVRRDSEPAYTPSSSLPPPPHPHYQTSGKFGPPPMHNAYALPPPPPHYSGLPPPPTRSEPTTPAQGSFSPNQYGSHPPSLPPISTAYHHPSMVSPALHTAPPHHLGSRPTPYPPLPAYTPSSAYSQGPPTPYETQYGPPPPSPGSRTSPHLPPPAHSPPQSHLPPPYRSPERTSRPGSAHRQAVPGPMLPPLHASPRAQHQQQPLMSPRLQHQGHPSPQLHATPYISPRSTLPPPPGAHLHASAPSSSQPPTPPYPLLAPYYSQQSPPPAPPKGETSAALHFTNRAPRSGPVSATQTTHTSPWTMNATASKAMIDAQSSQQPPSAPARFISPSTPQDYRSDGSQINFQEFKFKHWGEQATTHRKRPSVIANHTAGSKTNANEGGASKGRVVAEETRKGARQTKFDGNDTGKHTSSQVSGANVALGDTIATTLALEEQPASVTTPETPTNGNTVSLTEASKKSEKAHPDSEAAHTADPTATGVEQAKTMEKSATAKNVGETSPAAAETLGENQQGIASGWTAVNHR